MEDEYQYADIYYSFIQELSTLIKVFEESDKTTKVKDVSACI